MGVPAPPGTAQGTDKIGVTDAFLKKGVDVGVDINPFQPITYIFFNVLGLKLIETDIS